MASSVTGLNETIANLDSVARSIDAASREALLDTAYEGAHAASGKAPVVSGRLRDSFVGAGRERDSLGPGGVYAGVEKRGPFAEIGSRVEYAAKIEYTDTAMLRPAVHAMEEQLIENTQQRVVRTMSRRVK